MRSVTRSRTCFGVHTELRLFVVLILLSTIAVEFTAAWPQFAPSPPPSPTPPPPATKPLPGDDGPCGTTAECNVIFALFSHSGPDCSVIRRQVTQSAAGYHAYTTSANAKVVSLLQRHVESMRARVREMRPINTWDPFYAALFNNSHSYSISTENLTNGVWVNETGRSACAVAVLKEHSNEVTRFVNIGQPEMAGPAHYVPKQCPSANTHH